MGFLFGVGWVVLLEVGCLWWVGWYVGGWVFVVGGVYMGGGVIGMVVFA